MRKYKLIEEKDKKKPDKKVVLKYKSFDNLTYNYKQLSKPPKPIYKDPKTFFIILLIALIAYLIATQG